MTGEKLNNYLKERGIRARWLSGRLNMTPQAIYLKMKGDIKITIEDALIIKKACRMTDDEFRDIFGGEQWYKVL